MAKHLSDLLSTPSPQHAATALPRCMEDVIFEKIKDKFPLIVFSCVQLASKLSLQSCVSSEMPNINTLIPRYKNKINFNFYLFIYLFILFIF